MRTMLALIALSLCLVGTSPRVSTAAPGLIRSWGGFGTDPGQFNNPYGIVVDDNQVVYVTDEANDRIQTFDSTGVFLSQWGTFGSSPGQLFNPTGIDIGPDGLAYISDHQNHRISVFTSNGNFVRVLSAPGLSYPVGLDCEPSGNLWVASLFGLFHFSSTGTLLQSIGMFNGESPYGITADGNTLYASLCGADRIDKITLSPFYEQPFAASGLFCPEGSLPDANGDFLVCDTGHDRVLKYDPSGALIGQLQLSTNPRAIPSDIALDSNGDLYIAEWGVHRIEKYSSTAFSIPTCTGPVSAGGPYLTDGIGCAHLSGVASDPVTWTTSGSGTFDPDNTTLDANYCPSAEDVAAGSVTLTLTAGLCPSSNATLTIVTPPPSFSFIRAWGTPGSGPGQFDRPIGIVIDESQTVYVTDSGNNRIQKFDSTGVFLGEWGTFGSSPGQLWNPTGIDIGPDGLAYVSDNANQRISVFTRDGSFVRMFNLPHNPTDSYPVGLDCEPSGNLWVAALTGFYRFSPTGHLLETVDASDGSAGWVTADGNNLYGSHCSINGVQKYTLSPPSVQTFASDLFCPEGSLLDADGNVWVCDTGNDRIRKYAPSGALLRTLQLSTSPRAIPWDIAFDVNRDLYVTESGLNRIAKYSVGGHNGAPCTVSAGGPYASCGNACVQLHGDVDPALTGTWSTNGSGTFSPDNTTLDAMYCPSAADVATGSVTLTLTAEPCPGVDATLTISPAVPVMAMEVDPNTINAGAGGNYVSAHLEFPSGYDPAQVQLDTVLLNGTVAASPDFFDIKDWNHNHVPDLTVKFDRDAVEASLPEGNEVPISITGLIDASCFAGTTTVRVIRPKLNHPNGGESYVAGVRALVEWENPQGWTVSYAQIYYSADGGDSWSLVADNVIGTSYVWAAPATPTENGRLRVVLVDDAGVMGYDSSDGPFAVRSSTGIGDAIPTSSRLYQNSPNPFQSATRIQFDVPEATRVTLKVFDLPGREVKALADSWFPAGSHDVSWDARDAAGHPVAGGIYFIQLQAGSFTDTKRMYLQR